MNTLNVVYGNGFEMTSKSQRVDRLEAELINQPQVDCPVREYFADGLYAREITIPQGVALIGAVHKTQNFAVVNKGILRLATDDGYRDVKAGDVVTVMPGQKNCGYAIETCVWTNFFANPSNEQDSDKLVPMFSEAQASDLIGGSSNKQLAVNRHKQLEV